MEGADINRSSGDNSVEWTSQDHQGSSGQANQAPEGCNSAPPTTLEFESQSAATSLGYITHPVSARDHTSSDAALEGLARSEHEGDVPDAAGDSFEFERQAQENREQHVPLTAPIERGFEMNSASAARFQFPTQHAHPHPQSMDPAGTADRRSPYLPPFRAAYSMPDRSYSDSGTYGRSPSPAMHPGQHSMPEPYAHPGFVHQPGYHYVPQPNGSSSVPPNGHDMAAIPRMPPYATSDPYLRQQQSMPPPGYGHVRSAVPFPSSQQQQQQHQQQQQQQMPTALPMSAAPGSSVTPRPKSAEDNGQLVSLDRSLPPAAPPAAKPGQNQGTPFISKLMHLLSNDRYSAYIRWNSAGDAFILSHTNQYFASQVLPLYFRHSNTSSFIRQLNLYQFQRLPIMQLLETLDDGTSGALAGATAPSSCFSGFSHPLFKRDQEELSYMIKPKPGKVRDRSAAAVAARKASKAQGNNNNDELESPVPDTPMSRGSAPRNNPGNMYKSDPARSHSHSSKAVRRSRRFESSEHEVEHDHMEEFKAPPPQMMYPAYAGMPQ